MILSERYKYDDFYLKSIPKTIEEQFFWARKVLYKETLFSSVINRSSKWEAKKVDNELMFLFAHLKRIANGFVYQFIDFLRNDDYFQHYFTTKNNIGKPNIWFVDNCLEYIYELTENSKNAKHIKYANFIANIFQQYGEHKIDFKQTPKKPKEYFNKIFPKIVEILVLL